MKTLFNVFDAITDSAIEEFYEENTKSPAAIDKYAEAAMNLNLTKEQALILYYAFKADELRKSEAKAEYQSVFYYEIESVLDEVKVREM